MPTYLNRKWLDSFDSFPGSQLARTTGSFEYSRDSQMWHLSTRVITSFNLQPILFYIFYIEINFSSRFFVLIKKIPLSKFSYYSGISLLQQDLLRIPNHWFLCFIQIHQSSIFGSSRDGTRRHQRRGGSGVHKPSNKTPNKW
jgi:hypothetical protein